MNAGQGATQHRDGYTMLSFPSNLSNTPIEVFEQMAPLRVIERASGAAAAARASIAAATACASRSKWSATRR